jgi:hypothetical protein
MQSQALFLASGQQTVQNVIHKILPMMMIMKIPGRQGGMKGMTMRRCIPAVCTLSVLLFSF